MNKNKDLECSGYPEQASKPGTAPNGAGRGPEAGPAEPAAEHLAAFARRLGVNRSTVTRAAQVGRLVLNAQGLVLIEPSLNAWAASKGLRDDVAHRHATARLGQPQHPAPENAASAPFGPSAGLSQRPATPPATPPEPGSRADHQAAALRAQNAHLALQIALQRGQALPRAALLAELQGLGGILRAAVERLIDQTAPRLAAADPAQRRPLLLAELATVRRQLRREFPRALRRLAPAVVGLTSSAQEPTP